MIKLFIIRIILFFTWFNSLGFHIRYRLKKMGFINRRVGWTITLFKSFDNLIKKNWKRIKTIGWFSIEQEKLYSNSDVQGLADPKIIPEEEGNFNKKLHKGRTLNILDSTYKFSEGKITRKTDKASRIRSLHRLPMVFPEIAIPIKIFRRFYTRFYLT